MPDSPFTRRHFLALAGASLAVAAAPPPPPAGLIDTHVHLAEPRIPGVLSNPVGLAPFAKDADLNRLAAAFSAEAKAVGLTQALVMPRLEISDADPLGVRDAISVIDRVKGPKLHPVGVAHPERFDRDHLARVEAVLKLGRVKALKAYLGYLHYEPYSPGYRKYFALAAKYNVPVIFHCGDTFSRTAKVKFAHPLKIDEVAVDYPDTTFVIAHFGNPWLTDAAQVVYKNKNVYADLSGILIGDAAAFAQMRKDGVTARTATRIKEAVEYTEAPERFLFGTDWPLAPIAAYRDFVAPVFPAAVRSAVLGGNAKRLFGL